ncbi:MAG: glycogen synthase GlgA [Nitrospinota bacterium]
MNILMMASEMAPFAKTGGLGDVMAALPESLLALGEEVRVVIPLYPRFMKGRFDTEPVETALRLPFKRRDEVVGIHQWTSPKGLIVYFVAQDNYFDRDGLYGDSEGDFPDNAARFSCFTLAGLESCRLLGWKPDVIHAHDWHASLAPAYLKRHYADDPVLGGARSICTIHNVAFQGLFPGESFGVTELPDDLFSADGLEFFGEVNFLKGGILFSDLITTVSEKYSQEIQTEEFGCGLAGFLRRVSGKLRAILNGVDYGEWDPSHDPYLPVPYDVEHLERKRQGRAALLADCGLPDTGSPLIGMVTRLTHQKGIDLLAGTIDRLMALDLSLILLGMGERNYEEILRETARRYPEKAAVFIQFDNGLAHRIEAGADVFLMPSRYEPCGLNQIYSLRYGTVPIVRATGGLDDTIEAFDPVTLRGNGIKFEEYTPEALLRAVREALGYFADPPLWATLMKNGMSAYFGWEVSARKYQQVYREACAR